VIRDQNHAGSGGTCVGVFAYAGICVRGYLCVQNTSREFELESASLGKL